MIQTLDFFTPIVDDPFHFGQITAANALSDVYAMGGKPLLAMNILACPIKTMEAEIFRDVIRGGLSKIEEAGALLVGGHSIEDDELKYGLSVTGIVHPDRVLLNKGAKPGDRLILTKPIGTGILSTALKGGLAGADSEAMMVQVMATLNKTAAEIIDRVRLQGLAVHACTDVTGFGLLGHLHEMLAASGLSARIDSNRIPVLPEAMDFIDMGIIPEGAHRNRDFYLPHLHNNGQGGENMEFILSDPQTSGGLLIAAEPEAAATIISLLRKESPLACAEIGEITTGESSTIQLD